MSKTTDNGRWSDIRGTPEHHGILQIYKVFSRCRQRNHTATKSPCPWLAVPQSPVCRCESDQLEPCIGICISSYACLVASIYLELNMQSWWQSRHLCQMQLLHRNTPNTGMPRSSTLDQVEHTTVDHIRLTTNHNEHLTSLDLSITYCSISGVIRSSTPTWWLDTPQEQVLKLTSTYNTSKKEKQISRN